MEKQSSQFLGEGGRGREVTYRVDPSRQSLSQDDDVGAHPLVVHRQPPARPRQSGLDLVGDPQHLCSVSMSRGDGQQVRGQNICTQTRSQ